MHIIQDEQFERKEAQETITVVARWNSRATHFAFIHDYAVYEKETVMLFHCVVLLLAIHKQQQNKRAYTSTSVFLKKRRSITEHTLRKKRLREQIHVTQARHTYNTANNFLCPILLTLMCCVHTHTDVEYCKYTLIDTQ